MKTGARTELTGEVIEVKKGTLMSLCKVKIPAESVIGSVMTLESLDDLGIKEGETVKVVVKAVNVLLIKE